MEQSKYDELLVKLSKARKEYAVFKGDATALLEAFKTENSVYVTSLGMSARAQAEIEQYESELRAAAIADYAANGIKKPHPKVTVKTFRVFKILDMAKVREWVDSKLPDALVMDLKKVEKYAKEIGPVEGTTIDEEPRAEIASALD